MQPRELPNLTVGNRPTMGHDHGVGYGQRGFRWLVAGCVGLLVAAGVTFSFVAQTPEKTKKAKTAVVQPKDHSLAPKVQPRPEPDPLKIKNAPDLQ